MVADARLKQRIRPTFDHGWFVIVALPIYVPYYLISTRGCLLLASALVLLSLPSFEEVTQHYNVRVVCFRIENYLPISGVGVTEPHGAFTFTAA